MQLAADPADSTLATLKIEGEFDADAAEAILLQMERLLDRGMRGLVVDCSRLTHISSSGLGVLIRVHHRLRKHAGMMRVAAISGPAAQAMRMTHLDRVFECDPDLATARSKIAAAISAQLPRLAGFQAGDASSSR